jgi:hypothetical protein
MRFWVGFLKREMFRKESERERQEGRLKEMNRGKM